jgi:hypothetical protein
MNAESNDKPYQAKELKWGDKVITGVVVGRNKTVVPPDEVEHLASLGCSDREIAQYFDISESTLRYQLSSFLIKGRHNLKTTLRQAQLRVALEGNPTMLIWLGKNILQQNDNGTASDDKRPLPWTDNMDNDTIDDDDNHTEVVEEHNVDTEAG